MFFHMYLLALAEILLVTASPDKVERAHAIRWLIIHFATAIMVFFAVVFLLSICFLACMWRFIPHTRGGLYFVLFVIMFITLLLIAINESWADLLVTYWYFVSENNSSATSLLSSSSFPELTTLPPMIRRRRW